MVAYNRAARMAAGNEQMSIEAAITGLIDEFEVKPEYYHGDLDPERVLYKKRFDTA